MSGTLQVGQILNQHDGVQAGNQVANVAYDVVQ